MDFLSVMRGLANTMEAEHQMCIAILSADKDAVVRILAAGEVKAASSGQRNDRGADCYIPHLQRSLNVLSSVYVDAADVSNIELQAKCVEISKILYTQSWIENKTVAGDSKFSSKVLTTLARDCLFMSGASHSGERVNYEHVVLFFA